VEFSDYKSSIARFSYCTSIRLHCCVLTSGLVETLRAKLLSSTIWDPTIEVVRLLYREHVAFLAQDVGILHFHPEM